MRVQAPHPRLRAWAEADAPAFAAMHADPAVTDWLGGSLSDAAARAAFDAIRQRMADNGWGMWAVQDDDGVMVGAAGLQPVRQTGIPGYPGVEAAWRLLPRARGKGYVTLAMKAVLADGFQRFGFDEIVAYTARSNLASQAVMGRLGFQREADRDFLHPILAPEHPLAPHVFYRMSRPRGAMS